MTCPIVAKIIVCGFFIFVPIWIGSELVSQKVAIEFNLEAAESWVTRDCLLLSGGLKKFDSSSGGKDTEVYQVLCARHDGDFRGTAFHGFATRDTAWRGISRLHDARHRAALAVTAHEATDIEATTRARRSRAAAPPPWRRGKRLLKPQVVLLVQPFNLSSYMEEMGDDLFNLTDLFYGDEKIALRYPSWEKKDTDTMFARFVREVGYISDSIRGARVAWHWPAPPALSPGGDASCRWR